MKSFQEVQSQIVTAAIVAGAFCSQLVRAKESQNAQELLRTVADNFWWCRNNIPDLCTYTYLKESFSTDDLLSAQIYLDGTYEVKEGVAVALGNCTVKGFGNCTVEARDNCTVISRYFKGGITILPDSNAVWIDRDNNVIYAYGIDVKRPEMKQEPEAVAGTFEDGSTNVAVGV